MKKIFSFIATFSFFLLVAQVTVDTEYICPPCNNSCDQLDFDKPGVCSHCNMVLVRKDLSKTIAFYLQDGVEVLDFAGPMEVFSYAGYKVFTVSKEKKPIKSQGILTIVPDYSIEDAPEADILAFFGGNSNAASGDEKVVKWVSSQKNIQYHFSVCTGAFILAEADILNGKTATTFHSALDGLEENYPEIDVRKDVRYVDNGRVITTAGISAGIDGALHLVAKLQGLNAAKRTAYYMEYDNWVPGDGLILSEDDPYKPTIKENELKAFEGEYEYKNGTQIVLKAKKDELFAIVQGLTYPIYHEAEDIFSDVGSEPVYFERNSDGRVVGYRLTPDGDIYQKID
ncbi:DJ-1/PfpI family protein [Ekhidna sp.]